MSSARSISLASRRSIEERDLYGLKGAEHIINTIRSRPTVTRLILGHNTLGDTGCSRLFDFLGSSEGIAYPISEISLNKNGIGNEGLRAIVNFLRENTRLRLLFLQYNRFEPDVELSRAFAESVNQSRLSILSLSTNSGFSDQFMEAFLSTLNSPTLRELHVSACRLTPLSRGPIGSFITSPRCRLRTFKCNGNELGLQAVQAILEDMEPRNWTITTLELLSNGNIADNNLGVVDLYGAWKEVESKIKRLTIRNTVMQKQTQSQALILLRCSRPLLIVSAQSTAQTSQTLPTEIILHILSFIAPNLSKAQRLRVFQYASDIKTLPPLLPKLISRSSSATMDCTPDPSSMSFLSVHQGCQDGRCMSAGNTTTCRREGERFLWLDQVGCSFYEGPEA